MSSDFLPINNIDHLEYYVGNARQSAHFYHAVFGFLSIAQTKKRGATVVCPPTENKDEFGTYRHGSIATYGEVIHTFVDREDYAGPFAPGYEPIGRRRLHGDNDGAM